MTLARSFLFCPKSVSRSALRASKEENWSEELQRLSSREKGVQELELSRLMEVQSKELSTLMDDHILQLEAKIKEQTEAFERLLESHRKKFDEITDLPDTTADDLQNLLLKDQTPELVKFMENSEIEELCLKTQRHELARLIRTHEAELTQMARLSSDGNTELRTPEKDQWSELGALLYQHADVHKEDISHYSKEQQRLAKNHNSHVHSLATDHLTTITELCRIKGEARSQGDDF